MLDTWVARKRRVHNVELHRCQVIALSDYRMLSVLPLEEWRIENFLRGHVGTFNAWCPCPRRPEVRAGTGADSAGAGSVS